MPSILWSLLLFQIFTETTEPTNPDGCVAVRYLGTTYKALKSERTRLTDTITLTMPGEWEPVGPPPRTTPEQQRAVSAYAECEAARLRRMEEEHKRWSDCRKQSDCPDDVPAEKMWECFARPP